MPVIGKLIGGVSFADLQVVLTPASMGADGKEIAAVALRYGAFIQSIIDFTLVAFAVFLFVKVINRLHRKQEAAPAPPAEPSAEVLLLTEIRDALRAPR
jgi:large conductance mechanosensitive channel